MAGNTLLGENHEYRVNLRKPRPLQVPSLGCFGISSIVLFIFAPFKPVFLAGYSVCSYNYHLSFLSTDTPCKQSFLWWWNPPSSAVCATQNKQHLSLLLPCSFTSFHSALNPKTLEVPLQPQEFFPDETLLKAWRMLHIYDCSRVPLPPLWFELQGNSTCACFGCLRQTQEAAASHGGTRDSRGLFHSLLQLFGRMSSAFIVQPWEFPWLSLAGGIEG